MVLTRPQAGRVLTLMSTDSSYVSDSGFSLIEAIAVLVIFGLLTGITLTSVRSVQERANWNQNLAKLEAMIEKGREQSILSSVPLSLNEFREEVALENDMKLSDIVFSDDAEVYPYGVCTEGSGKVLMNGEFVDFKISPLTCEIVF